MEQKRKNLTIGLILFTVVFTIAAFITIILTGNSGPKDRQIIIGTWTEEATDLEVAFEAGNVFKVMNGQAAVYEVDQDNHTITFTYAPTYGGQTVNMTYSLTDDTLKLVNTKTKEEQLYHRVY